MGHSQRKYRNYFRSFQKLRPAVHIGKPKKLKDVPSSFDMWATMACGGIIAVFGAAAALPSNHFSSMWIVPSTANDMGLFIIRIALFAEFAILALRWVIATRYELSLWIDWLVHPSGTLRVEIYGSIIGLAVVLGLSLALVHNIVFISGFLTVSFLFNYWTQWLSNDHFEQALNHTRKRECDETTKGVLKILENYWKRRPQLARLTTMMFFSSIAFNLASTGSVLQEPLKHRFQMIAYWILIMNIFVGEIFISWWRHKRNQQIREITGTVEELRLA